MAKPEDIAHFNAISIAMDADERERTERADNMSPGDRILMGVKMGRETPWTGAHLAEIDARADGQMELARRRIALGIVREYVR